MITIDTCYKTAKIAKILGASDVKAEAEQYYAVLRKNFRVHYVKNGKIKEDSATQTGVAMTLYYKAFEQAEEAGAVKQLLALIEEKNGCLDTGVLGARVLFRTLSDHGHADVAYRLITQSKYPPYKYILDCGATTLWENFQEIDGDRMERKDGRKLDSMNHHFLGDISAWFYKYVGGIRINPG